MNRRNFLGSLLVAGASFAILPGAGRIWVAERPPMVSGYWDLWTKDLVLLDHPIHQKTWDDIITYGFWNPKPIYGLKHFDKVQHQIDVYWEARGKNKGFAHEIDGEIFVVSERVEMGRFTDIEPSNYELRPS